MPRYATIRPKAYVIHTEDGVSWAPSLEVDGPACTDTGLVDLDGNPIMRLPTPIGFRVSDEDD